MYAHLPLRILKVQARDEIQVMGNYLIVALATTINNKLITQQAVETNI